MITQTSQETGREPGVALNLTLERTPDHRRWIAGKPTVAEVVSVIGVVMKIFDLADSVRETALGPLSVTKPPEAIGALAVVDHEGTPLIISAGQLDGTLRSWRLDGTGGPLSVDDAHPGGIGSLAVVDHEGTPLIISAGQLDGTLRSWRLDGTTGPLSVDHAHFIGRVGALTVVEYEGAPLIISAGHLDISAGRLDGTLRSWRLDGTAGPLVVHHTHFMGHMDRPR